MNLFSLCKIPAIAGAIFFSCFLFPAHAQNQSDVYEYNPIAFDAPVTLARGRLAPMNEAGFHLSAEDTCHLVTTDWGWERSSCAAIDKMFVAPTASLDTLLVERPNSEGFVRFDDWDNSNRDQEIESIWNALEESIQAQSEKLGVEIKADSWLVYPTLDEEKNYLYYATKLIWDGQPQINIKATVFDRRGYVVFVMVPLDASMPATQVKQNIDGVLSAYSTKTSEAYADFSEGDKVASAGVLGVLAGLVGVKYGKAVAVGLGAILLGFAKKLWILLLLPLIALKNKLFGKKD